VTACNERSAVLCQSVGGFDSRGFGLRFGRFENLGTRKQREGCFGLRGSKRECVKGVAKRSALSKWNLRFTITGLVLNGIVSMTFGTAFLTWLLSLLDF
jgi:hypothetical protein